MSNCFSPYASLTSETDNPTNTTEQRAVERMFENAIQACSDLAQHIATHDFAYEGAASKEAIRVLGHNGVIDEETMNTLVVAVGFRNVLAHEYGKVDYVEVYETLQTGLEIYDTSVDKSPSGSVHKIDERKMTLANRRL